MTAATLLRFAFFIVIGVVAYFYWRDFGRREIETWPTRVVTRLLRRGRACFVVDIGWYAAIGVSGRDILAFLVVAGDLRLRRRHDVARAALGSLTAIPSSRSSASRSGMCWPTKIGVSRSV